jgi:hypothetical protein
MSYFTQYHYSLLIHSRPHVKSYRISSTCHNTAIPCLISDRRPRPYSSRCRDWTHRNPFGPHPKVGSDKGLNRVMSSQSTVHRGVVDSSSDCILRFSTRWLSVNSDSIASSPASNLLYSIRLGTKYRLLQSHLGPRTLIPRSLWR